MDLGWLSPDGTFYKCAHMEHISTAYDLVEKYNINKELHSRPDDWLDTHGWVHITRSIMFDHTYRIYWDKHLTEPQKQYLKPLIEEDWDLIPPFIKVRWESEL